MQKACFVFLLLFSPLIGAKQLSVAIYDYPPAFIVKNGDKPGYCFEIIEHLYSQAGYEVTKFELNLPRAMHSVETQEIDLLCAVNTFNSSNLALSKTSLASVAFYFWAHKDSEFFYDGIESLKGQRILNIAGFNYSSASEEYQNYLEKNQHKVIYLNGVQPLKRAFSMLAAGRADIIALDRDNAYYNAKKLNLENEIKMVGRLPNILPAFLGVAKDHPAKSELLGLFDGEYPKLVESGLVDKILQKYDVFTRESATQISVGNKPAHP